MRRRHRVIDGRRADGFAIASVILGILWIFGVGSIGSVVCGHAAVSTIRSSDGRLRGIVGARAGLVIGYLGRALGGVFVLELLSL